MYGWIQWKTHSTPVIALLIIERLASAFHPGGSITILLGLCLGTGKVETVKKNRNREEGGVIFNARITDR